MEEEINNITYIEFTNHDKYFSIGQYDNQEIIFSLSDAKKIADFINKVVNKYE